MHCMTETKHGIIVKAEFRSEKEAEKCWSVSVDAVFQAHEDIRLPVTFSILGKATTKLISLEKGNNNLSFCLSVEDPVKNFPLNFIGTESTEALLRIDGESITGSVSFH